MAAQLRAIALLPGMVALAIPALIVWRTREAVLGWSAVAGVALIALGLALVGWTVALFVRVGKGTLAPWDPTSRPALSGLSS